jgi:acyl-CoA dehydrogenase
MNEMRTILEQSVNRLFEDQLGWDAQTAIEQSGWPQALWQQVIDQGIDRVLGAEDAGGINGSWADAYPVLRACGRHAVPLPIAEANVCHWLAREAGVVLPDGVPGLLAVNLHTDTVGVVLQQARVPWGRNADYLVGMADSELVIASPAGLGIEQEDNIGRDPRDRLSGTAAIISRHKTTLPGDAIHVMGALARSAQIAGGGAAALDLAIQYASEREQFGRALARFQAIQHHLADLAGVVASADAISMAACEAFDNRGIGVDGRSARFEIAVAKSRASDGVEKMTRLSHQVHGAIGFTYEYGLHFVTRRLWAWRAEFGSASAWSEYLGRVAAEQGGDGIWPWMTD